LANDVWSALLLAAIVDECQVQCVLLNDGVDPIVRRSFEAVDAAGR
jgi:hypothetical protein